MSATINDYNQRLSVLKTDRSSYIHTWQDMTDHILPQSGRFFTQDRNKGNKVNSKIIDSTTSFAVRTLSAGMMAGITNPARPWFSLRVLDPAMNERYAVKEWLETVRNLMSELFISSNVYNALPLLYKEVSVFGTAAFIMLENKRKTMRCHSYPVGSFYLGQSWEGTIDTCYREYQMSAAQMVKQFGMENCSSKVQQAVKETGRDTYFDVVFAIEPNDDFDDTKFESKYKKFRSVYYEKSSSEQKFLQQSGFDEFPVMAPRWEVTGEDVYGYGPAWDALGDIKALQIEQKRKIQAIDKGVSPPMSAPSTLEHKIISQLPGAITFMDVTQGQQAMQPIYQINPTWLQYLTQDIRETQGRIKRAFFEDLFLLISQDDRSGITAHEIVARSEEKMLILGPVLTRLNDELHDPMIDRAFNIMSRSRKLPPAPPEIQGMNLTVEYISTMAQAMKMTGISGIERISSFTAQIASTFPTVLDLFNSDEAVISMAEMLSTPTKILRDEKEVTAVRQTRAQQDSIRKKAELAASAAATTKTLADAQMTDPSALSGLLGAYQNQGGQAQTSMDLSALGMGQGQGVEGAA
jgi:hypothetical protein